MTWLYVNITWGVVFRKCKIKRPSLDKFVKVHSDTRPWDKPWPRNIPRQLIRWALHMRKSLSRSFVPRGTWMQRKEPSLRALWDSLWLADGQTRTVCHIRVLCSAVQVRRRVFTVLADNAVAHTQKCINHTLVASLESHSHRFANHIHWRWLLCSLAVLVVRSICRYHSQSYVNHALSLTLTNSSN